MRRTLHFKRLVCLMATVALLGGGIHFLHAFQVKRQAGTLLQQATRAEEEYQAQGDSNQLENAAEYLGRYLVLVPHDSNVRGDYGLILDELADETGSRRTRQQAFEELETAVRRNQSRDDLRRRLVDVAMHPAVWRLKDAEEHLKILLQSQTKDPELERLLAHCYEAQGDFVEPGTNSTGYEKAVDTYKKAIQLYPTSHAPKGRIESYARAADLLRRRLNKAEDADKLMDEVVSKDDPTAEEYLARGRDRREHNKLKLAAEDLAEARKLEPDNADVLLESAVVARYTESLPAARDYLRQSLDLRPREPRIYRELAQVERQAGKFDDAEATLRRGIKELPDSAELRWSLVDLQVDRGKLTAAGEQIKDLRRSGFREEVCQYLEARIQLSEGNWVKAQQMLERLEPQFERSAATEHLAKRTMEDLAQCCERLGNFDRAFELYKRILNLDPRWFSARHGAARTLLALGRLDEALGLYQQMVVDVPQLRLTMIRMQIARMMRQPKERRDWGTIKQSLDQAAQADLDRTELALLRAEVLAAEEHLDQAARLVTKARDENLLVVGASAVGVVSSAEGSRPLLAAIALSPRRIRLEPWVALVSVAERQGKLKEAWSLLQELEARFGDRVEIRLAKAGHLYRLDDSKQKQAIAQLAEHIDAFTAAEQETLLRSIGQVLLKIGDVDGAFNLWREVARRKPNDLAVRLVLFDIARQPRDGTQAKDVTAAEKVLEDLKKDIEGDDGVFWRYGQVCLLLRKLTAGTKDKPSIDEARKLLAELRTRRPSWARVPALEGELYELEDEPELAIRKYMQAFELGERDSATIRRLLQLLSLQNRFVEAQQIVARMPEQMAISGDLQRLVAGISFQNQDFGRAFDLAKKVDAKDHRDHLWLAQLAWASGDKKRAEQEFRAARQMSPDSPEVWVAALAYLAGTDRKQEALTLLEEAQKKLPRETHALALAACQEMLGRYDEAEVLYKAALQAKPGDPTGMRALATYYLRRGKVEKAEPILAKIIEQRALLPREAAWARRVLLEVRALAGDHQQAQRAVADLNLLDNDLPSDASRAERAQNLRAKAVILAVQKDSRQRLEAIKMLEKIKQDGTLSPDDQILLAAVYDSVGKWSEARDVVLPLLAARKLAGPYLLQFARGFLIHGQVDEAKLCLDQLEQQEKDRTTPSVASKALRARILKATGKVEDAVTLLKNYAQGLTRLSDEEMKRQGVGLQEVAQVLEEIKPAAAEEVYRQHVQHSAQKPESLLVLAAYLGRQGRAVEALDQCERCLGNYPVESMIPTAVSVLYDSHAEQLQAERVARWLETALAKNSGSHALLVGLGNVRNFQGQYRQAMSLYRKAIGPPNPSPEALNNLAWLLAFHGEPAEALALLNRAIEIVGPLPVFLDTRGIVELKLEKVDPALRDLTEAAMQRENSPNAYFHLAQAYWAAKKRDEAKEAWRNAKRLGLKTQSLHPLEENDYQHLSAELR
jgi:tetratricopeptide (TPR) repeat protein